MIVIQNIYTATWALYWKHNHLFGSWFTSQELTVLITDALILTTTKIKITNRIFREHLLHSILSYKSSKPGVVWTVQETKQHQGTCTKPNIKIPQLQHLITMHPAPLQPQQGSVLFFLLCKGACVGEATVSKHCLTYIEHCQSKERCLSLRRFRIATRQRKKYPNFSMAQNQFQWSSKTNLWQ